MHDPLVVAFEIRRPWPKRAAYSDAKPVPDGKRAKPRWRFALPYFTVAGKAFYFPGLITIWHREPGGADAGTVCKHHHREQGPDGKWRYVFHHAWKFHIRHWQIQVRPWQDFRRWAFTRCEWCGGRSRKNNAVNVSHQWDRSPSAWWRGERGLFHMDCSSVYRCHNMCLCTDPLFDYDGYGRCALCGKWRAYKADIDDAHRALAALPVGSRITPEVRVFVEPLWDERRRRMEKA